MSSIISLERALAVKPPANTWRWFIYMPDLANQQDPSKILAEAISLPNHNFGVQNRFRDGRYYNYPTEGEPLTVSITFYEDHHFTVTKYMTYWKRLVYDEVRGEYGVPAAYKRTLRFEQWDLNGNLAMIGILTGCYPFNIQNLDFNYGDDNRIQLNVQFNLDSIVKQVGFNDFSNQSSLTDIGNLLVGSVPLPPSRPTTGVKRSSSAPPVPVNRLGFVNDVKQTINNSVSGEGKAPTGFFSSSYQKSKSFFNGLFD
jgi:hypothetical protein